MVKVVFDTNVYISALLFGGLPQKLFKLAFENKFELYISPEINSEIFSVLIKKFEYSPTRARQVVSTINSITHLVHPRQTINVIKKWPADNRILECCYEAQANFLVSGDKKHLLPLKKFHSTQIVTTSQFDFLVTKS